MRDVVRMCGSALNASGSTFILKKGEDHKGSLACHLTLAKVLMTYTCVYSLL